MRRIFYEKIISLTIALLIACSFSISCFALSDIYGEEYTYKYDNGKTVKYYLDKHNMPFIVEKGECIYITLPLPHLAITDENILNELNAELFNTNSATRAIPTNTYKLTDGTEKKSNVYKVSLSFATIDIYTTPIFEFNSNHQAFRLKTTNIDKPFLASNLISYVFRYRSPYDDTWYQINRLDVNCTAWNGDAFRHDASSFPYGKVDLIVPKEIDGYTANIWTTLEY